jgi:ComF family protein
MRSLARCGSSFIQKVIKIRYRILSFIFPRYCLLCQEELLKSEAEFCILCNSKLAIKTTISWDNNHITDLLWGRVPVLFSGSLFCMRKDNLFKKAMYEFKYYNKPTIGKALSKIAAHKYKSKINDLDIDYLLSVPMHIDKQKKRGYNQSDIIAQTMEECWGIPIIHNVILKKENDLSQTKLNAWQRWENRAKGYELINKDLLKEKHILIIDDIITSGTTIEGLYKCLKNVPGLKVSLFTLGFSEN